MPIYYAGFEPGNPPTGHQWVLSNANDNKMFPIVRAGTAMFVRRNELQNNDRVMAWNTDLPGPQRGLWHSAVVLLQWSGGLGSTPGSLFYTGITGSSNTTFTARADRRTTSGPSFNTIQAFRDYLNSLGTVTLSRIDGANQTTTVSGSVTVTQLEPGSVGADSLWFRVGSTTNMAAFGQQSRSNPLDTWVLRI